MAQSVAPNELSSPAKNYAWHLLSTAAPVSLLGLFAIIHVQNWMNTGSLTGLGLAIQESILIVLFLIRRRPKESLNTVSAWVAALIGSYGVLLVQPSGVALFDASGIYVGVQLFGAALAVVTTLSLGKSFGIVAANRGVQTRGAYGIVRHPIYASYLVGFAGYLLAALSIWNVTVMAVALTFQIRRIHAEESVLMKDPAYQEYAKSVRYRLIPKIY